MMHLCFDFQFLSLSVVVIYIVNELASRTYAQSSFPLSAAGLPVDGQLGVITLVPNSFVPQRMRTDIP
jgi:hypothetical protein